jgi:adenylosuccinate lyase
MRAWETDGNFRASVESDKEVLSYLSVETIRQAFLVNRYLVHVDRIFARVFPETV